MPDLRLNYLISACLFSALCFAQKIPEGELIRHGHVTIAVPARGSSNAAAVQPPRVPAAPCNLQTSGPFPGLYTAGATSYTYHLRSTGSLRGVLLFLDFPDAPTRPNDATTQSLVSDLVPPYTKMMGDLSYNRLRVDITPIHKWYRMPRPFAAYPFRTYGNLRDFLQDIISVSDADVAFNTFDFVSVILPQSLDIDAAQAFVLLPDVAAVGDGAPMRFVFFVPRDLRFPDVFAHENLHLLGLQDLYLIDAATSDEAVAPFGRWDIMSIGFGMNAWNKEKLGWIDSTQLTCLAAGSGEATLTPVHTATGTKAAVVPISPTKVFVMEAREAVAADPALCESGVLVYSVDSSVDSGDGPFRIRPAKTTGVTTLRSCLTPEPNAFAAYDVGAGSVSQHFEPGPNLLFEVTGKQQSNYTVRVRQVANPAVLPTRLVKVSGDNQSAPLNRDVPQPLTVRVLNSAGSPVPNPANDEFLPVKWAVISGAATITSTGSDASGNATAAVRTAGSLAAITVRVSVGTTAEFFTIRVTDTRPAPSSIFNGATLTPSPLVAVAPDSWVVLKGIRLATATIAADPPYPTNVSGTSVTVRDSKGVNLPAPVYFVSPAQINFLIPANAAVGTAQIFVNTAEGTSATSQRVEVRAVAPGLFTASSGGSGVVAGFGERLLRTGERESIPLFLYNESTRTFQNLPLDLGAPDEPLYLVLYGTGFRNRSSLDRVLVTLRGLSIPVQYAGAQGAFAGLDQLNIGPLPPELRGAGPLAFTVEVDGEISNRVTVDIF
ncbi:MAG: hypothetical protein ABI972_25085 [Acidobacteriota bacterium]